MIFVGRQNYACVRTRADTLPGHKNSFMNHFVLHLFFYKGVIKSNRLQFPVQMMFFDFDECLHMFLHCLLINEWMNKSHLLHLYLWCTGCIRNENLIDSIVLWKWNYFFVSRNKFVFFVFKFIRFLVVLSQTLKLFCTFSFRFRLCTL